MRTHEWMIVAMLAVGAPVAALADRSIDAVIGVPANAQQQVQLYGDASKTAPKAKVAAPNAAHPWEILESSKGFYKVQVSPDSTAWVSGYDVTVQRKVDANCNVGPSTQAMLATLGGGNNQCKR